MVKSKYFMYAPTMVKCSKKLHIAHVTKEKCHKMGKVSTQMYKRTADGNKKKSASSTHGYFFCLSFITKLAF